MAAAGVSSLQATADPESQIDLIPGLDLTCQADRFAARRVSDRSHAHRSDLDFRRRFRVARDERKRDRDDEGNAFHPGIALHAEPERAGLLATLLLLAKPRIGSPALS